MEADDSEFVNQDSPFISGETGLDLNMDLVSKMEILSDGVTMVLTISHKPPTNYHLMSDSVEDTRDWFEWIKQLAPVAIVNSPVVHKTE